MKTRAAVFLLVGLVAIIFSSNASAACPCHPCKCSPCTCGGGKSSSGGGKHHGKEHGHDHGSSFGVGGTVDLGGIGHRDAEANPFGVSNGEKPVTHTEEKRTTKRKEKQPTSSTFDEIKLTGKEAKDENNPPNTFNVDNEEPPKLPPSEVFTPKTVTIDDVKKAHDDYLNAWSEWAKKQPNWNSLVHDWTQSSSTEEGNKKSAKAKKKIDNLNNQFNAGDGKKLVDDWKTKFDNALKSGGKVEDNGLVPPPKDDIEKKKYAVIKAQNDLDWTKKNYDWIRQNAANKDEAVTNARDAINNLGATTVNDPKYKAAVADFDKAVKEAGAKWAATDEGKQEAQKLHDAEKELDKAKDAWKPFEKYVEK